MEKRTIYLVSCVSAKLEHAAPARALYASTWFKKARRYVEAQAACWYILSAKHGLVDPGEVLTPYEVTLNRMPASERCRWAARVLEALSEIARPGDAVVMLAGRRYREHLTPVLEARGITVEVPMEGLGIGQQLAWLKARTQ